MPQIPSELSLLVNGGVMTVNLYDLAVWVIVGLSAGFLASRLALGHGLGVVRELLVGVIGSVIGNLVFAFFHVSISVAGYPILSEIIVAFCGALALVLVLRLAGMGQHRRQGRGSPFEPMRREYGDPDDDLRAGQRPVGRPEFDPGQRRYRDPELRDDWRHTRG